MRSNASREERNRINLVINIIYVLLVADVIYIFIFSFVNFLRLCVPAIITGLLFLISLLVIYINRDTLGKIILIFSTTLSTIYFAEALGREANVQIILVGIFSTPIVLFRIKEFRNIIIGITIPLGGFIILEESDYSILFENSIDLQESFLKMISYSLTCTSGMIILFVIFFYYRENLDAQGKLREIIKKLRNTEKGLKQALFRSETAYDRAREDLEKSYKIQEKMANQAAYATLVRGICHELKNPLNIISLKAQTTPFKLGETKLILKDAKDIVTQVKKLNEIIENMLRFGLDGSPEREELSINEVILQSISISEDFFHRKKINIRQHLKETSLVHANRHQMEQVILNMMINASEAMPDGGMLTFETRKASFVSPDDRKVGEIEGIAVEITDTGIGMDEERIKKIFDPFSSSKRDNTGLGLAICHRIISNHGGLLQVTSKLGEGTSFTILIPQSNKPVASEEKIEHREIAPP